MKVCVVFAGLFIAVYSHLCLLNPYQRGDDDVDVDMWPNPECGYLNGPCGDNKTPDERTKHILVRDENYTVVMLKNVNHYNMAMPGNFTVNILDQFSNMVIPKAGSVKDTNATDGSIYQAVIMVSNTLVNGDPYVVQTIYYSNTVENGTPLIFYQCSDVIAF